MSQPYMPPKMDEAVGPTAPASDGQLERRLRTIVDNLPVFIGYWNEELRCEFANEPYLKTFGIPLEKIIGMTMREVLGEQSFKAAEPYARRALAGLPQQFERSLEDPQRGTTHHDTRYIPDAHAPEKHRGFFVLVSEVTTARNVQIALEAANAKLTHNVAGDFLTGLVNRRSFAASGARALDSLRGGEDGFGVLLIDIDFFSTVNASVGHDAGDKLLCEVGQVLKSQLRSHRDVAARINGATFGMLCFGEVDAELLSIVGESVRTRVAATRTSEKRASPCLTASIGLTTASVSDTGWDAIYSRAEAALYAAKLGGRDRLVVG